MKDDIKKIFESYGRAATGYECALVEAIAEASAKAMVRRLVWHELTEKEIEETSNHYTESEGFIHGAYWAQQKLKERNHE